MKKDFATIKEMANKKLLTATEKPNLLKIFEEKINNKIDELTKKQNAEYEEVEKQVLAELKQKAEVKKAVEKILQAEKDIKTAENTLSDNGLHLTSKSYSNEKRELSFNHGYGNGDKQPKRLKELSAKHDNKATKARELRNDLKLALFSPTITLADIVEIIDSELAKI